MRGVLNPNSIGILAARDPVALHTRRKCAHECATVPNFRMYDFEVCGRGAVSRAVQSAKIIWAEPAPAYFPNMHGRYSAPATAAPQTPLMR